MEELPGEERKDPVKKKSASSKGKVRVKPKKSQKSQVDKSEIIIDKGIPIPERPSKYPFSTMKVNESFAVDIAKEKNLRATAYIYGRKHDQKFSVQRVEGGQIRCWRVK